jgi:hypothetical protein
MRLTDNLSGKASCDTGQLTVVAGWSYSHNSWSVVALYALFSTGEMTAVSASEVYAPLLAEVLSRGESTLLLDHRRVDRYDNPYDPAQRRGIDVSHASYY